MSAERALRAADVSRSFDGLRAVDAVSLELRPGEIVGLIGPNGSGKTTLLNVVSGVLVPTAGRVTVDGVDVSGWPAHRVAALGVARTFQNIRLFGHLTVLENVAVGVSARRDRARRRDLRREAREVLEFLALGEATTRFADELPYGDQRRVEIARALATDPAYLLLDEPAAGLNEVESDRLLVTLRDLRDRFGPALLVIDHDLRLIMRLCERINVLNGGRTIAEGSPEAVRRDPGVIAAYLGQREADHVPAAAPDRATVPTDRPAPPA